MADTLYKDSNDSTAIPRNLVPVTPSDTVDLVRAVRGIMVNVSGDVFVDTTGGQVNVRLPNLAAGIWHPIHATRIYATGTTPTYIVGGY